MQKEVIENTLLGLLEITTAVIIIAVVPIILSLESIKSELIYVAVLNLILFSGGALFYRGAEVLKKMPEIIVSPKNREIRTKVQDEFIAKITNNSDKPFFDIHIIIKDTKGIFKPEQIRIKPLYKIEEDSVPFPLFSSFNHWNDGSSGLDLVLSDLSPRETKNFRIIIDNINGEKPINLILAISLYEETPKERWRIPSYRVIDEKGNFRKQINWDDEIPWIEEDRRGIIKDGIYHYDSTGFPASSPPEKEIRKKINS